MLGRDLGANNGRCQFTGVVHADLDQDSLLLPSHTFILSIQSICHSDAVLKCGSCNFGIIMCLLTRNVVDGDNIISMKNIDGLLGKEVINLAVQENED